MRFKRMMDHLKKVHGMTEETYRAKFPEASVRIGATLQRRVATVQDRYGVDNVFQAGDVKAQSKETMLIKYGGWGLQSPEIKARASATNLERYGAENPFGSEEIQRRIRVSNLERFGVENPNQAPEVMAKRIQTNQEKYGVGHYLLTDTFKVQFKDTSMKNWGVRHPMMSPGGKLVWETSNLKVFGVRTPLLLPEVQKRAYETNLANHNGQHSQKCPDVLAKARETWLEKYGTDNPSKVEAVWFKIKEVWNGKYGVPYPPQFLWRNQKHESPNGLEQRVQELSPPGVLFTGDRSRPSRVYPVRRPGTPKDRYPDFIVLTGGQMEAHRNGADIKLFRIPAVIEAFGDWWHGPEKTGKSREAHHDDVVAFYKDCGMRCLILWERDVNKRPQEVAERIRRFLIDVMQSV